MIKKLAYLAAFMLHTAGTAHAWTPIDVLLACVAEIGIEGQVETESGVENGTEYARVTQTRTVSKRETKRINTCADYSGGYTGLNLIAPKNALVRVAATSPDTRLETSRTVAPDPDAPHPLCVPGGGVMQRGGLICVGH